MHELSIGQAILDHVETRSGGRPVQRVEVRIGYLRQVVPDALQFAWAMLTAETVWAGVDLLIESVPAVVYCPACDLETTLDWPVLACSRCERHDVELCSGEELDLAWLDVGAQAR